MRVLKAATIDVWRFFEWRKGFSCAWVSINSQTHCTASLQSTWATSTGVERYNYIHQHSKLDSLLCESNCSLASPSKSSSEANVTVLFRECVVSASWAQIIAWRNRPGREMSIIEYTILPINGHSKDNEMNLLCMRLIGWSKLTPFFRSSCLIWNARM